MELPELFVDGASRRDVVQGALGDCWFLSSCAAVARKSKLIERVSERGKCNERCRMESVEDEERLKKTVNRGGRRRNMNRRVNKGGEEKEEK